MLKSLVIGTFAVFAISFGLFHAGEIATGAERIAEAFAQHFAVNLVNPIAPSAPTHTQQLAAAAQPTTQQFQDLSSPQHSIAAQSAGGNSTGTGRAGTTSIPPNPNTSQTPTSTTQQFQDLSSQQQSTRQNSSTQHSTIVNQQQSTAPASTINPLLAYATKADPDRARRPSPGGYAATI